MTEALTLNINVKEGGNGLTPVGGNGGIGSAVTAGFGIGAGLAAFQALTDAIKRGIEASPIAQGSMKLLDAAVNQILRPIGDIFGTLIRPLAIELLRTSRAWYEWIATVDGRVFMQTIQGIGEILAGIAKGFITLLPILSAGAGAAMFGTGVATGNPLLATAGIGLLGAGLAGMGDVSTIMDRLADAGSYVVGGFARIITASELAGQSSEGASTALSMLAQQSAPGLALAFTEAAIRGESFANNLSIAAQNILDSTSRIPTSVDGLLTALESASNRANALFMDRNTPPSTSVVQVALTQTSFTEVPMGEGLVLREAGFGTGTGVLGQKVSPKQPNLPGEYEVTAERIWGQGNTALMSVMR